MSGSTLKHVPMMRYACGVLQTTHHSAVVIGSFEQKCKSFYNNKWQTLGVCEKEQAVSGDTPNTRTVALLAVLHNMIGNDLSHNQVFHSLKYIRLLFI